MNIRHRPVWLAVVLAAAACAAPATTHVSGADPLNTPAPQIASVHPSAISSLRSPGATPVATNAMGPAQCGSWSAASSAFGKAKAQYGEEVACFPVQTDRGTVWVVVRDGATPAGSARIGGAVGIDRCLAAVATCADGRNDHTADRWTWYPVPGAKEATLWGVSGSVVEISTSAAIYLFDVNAVSPTFVPRPRVSS